MNEDDPDGFSRLLDEDEEIPMSEIKHLCKRRVYRMLKERFPGRELPIDRIRMDNLEGQGNSIAHIHNAIYMGDPEYFGELMSKLDVGSITDDMFLDVLCADSPSLLEYVLSSYDIDVNMDVCGEIPLYVCIQRGCIGNIVLILGHNSFRMEAYDQTAFEFCLRGRSVDVCKFIVACGFPTDTMLIHIARAENYRLIRNPDVLHWLLFESGLDVQMTDYIARSICICDDERMFSQDFQVQPDYPIGPNLMKCILSQNPSESLLHAILAENEDTSVREMIKSRKNTLFTGFLWA